MKDKNTTKKRRRYDAAFKANILKMNADGRSVSSLSESFGINENLIYRWKKAASETGTSSTGKDSKENLELRRQLQILTEERDILKKP